MDGSIKVSKPLQFLPEIDKKCDKKTGGLSIPDES